MTSFNPYVNWQASGGVNLWATVGYGSGEVEVEDSSGTQASDLSWRMAAAGVNGPLVASDQLISGGTTHLRVKGETAFTRGGLDGSEAIESMTLNASRHRLMLEGSHVQDLASGATFTPSIEIGLRSDGGDGETGTSVEAGGGLRYDNLANGLAIETRARTLLAHSGDYEEWGVSASIRLEPGARGRGRWFSVSSDVGATAGSAGRLWAARDAPGLVPEDGFEASRSLRAEAGWGLPAFGGRFTGTPNAGRRAGRRRRARGARRLAADACGERRPRPRCQPRRGAPGDRRRRAGRHPDAQGNPQVVKSGKPSAAEAGDGALAGSPRCRPFPPSAPQELSFPCSPTSPALSGRPLARLCP